jgi:hypothetical protein
MNRMVNPALPKVLLSPAHGLASGRLALITYTGRRSGRESASSTPTSSGGFDWGDAKIGAGATLVLVSLGAVVVIRRGRGRGQPALTG